MAWHFQTLVDSRGSSCLSSDLSILHCEKLLQEDISDDTWPQHVQLKEACIKARKACMVHCMPPFCSAPPPGQTVWPCNLEDNTKGTRDTPREYPMACQALRIDFAIMFILQRQHLILRPAVDTRANVESLKCKAIRSEVRSLKRP